MDCLRHGRAVFLILALFVPPGAFAAYNGPQQQPATNVRLRWEKRAGVSRYRLQIARDGSFNDIVVDRLVTGNELEVRELAPGRYLWRVAPLTRQLGAFSPAVLIEVKQPVPEVSPRSTPKVEVTPSSIMTGAGWRAAVGDVQTPVVAHLRSPASFDVVTMNAGGIVLALDAASGAALWSFRPFNQRNVRAGSADATLMVVPSRSRLDNIAVVAGTLVVAIEGATGRERWRSTLPAASSSGALVSDGKVSGLVIVDNSRQRLFIIRDGDGALISQIKLPGRVMGAPVGINHQGKAAFAISYDTGDIEIRDIAGAVIRSGNAASAATTAPLFVRGRRGDMILLGTRDGLTALAADDLRPLGRVAVKGDAPRGMLMAEDLDRDGVPEVIMTTERRHLIAVDATDGRIVWDVAAENFGDALAFADINRDNFSDVFVSGGQRFAVALSGRDGSVIWKDSEAAGLSTNHATPFDSRVLIAVPAGSGVLLIGGDPSRTGLRAIAFTSAAVRR